MLKRIIMLMVSAALIGLPSLIAPAQLRADNKEKDDQRLENSGTVMKEIMNIPDNIPQNLLDKAECVIVIPSVIKAAFVVGGSYGRGAMTCRSGENFTRRASDRLRFARDERPGR
jgi:lipid-binding SYLF domain-containing protein